MGTITAVFSAWFVGLLVLFVVGRQLVTRRRTRERVFEQTTEEAAGATSDPEDEQGVLTRWLSLAGFRGPAAVPVFLISTLVGLGLGLFLAYTLIRVGAVPELARLLGRVPGGVGDIFLPLIYVTPWLGVPLFGLAPWLVVHRARKRRIAQVEQDLPLVLELMATLSEAGLGFDAALARILESQPPHRPLASELRSFQTEVLAGQARVRCLRRLARRLDIMGVTIFTSSLVQAEQMGSGVAEVLRRQSDDLRDRRRENAIALATSLPAKLLFPLVICFLPAIFAVTLGPTFFQFFQFVDSVIHGRMGP